MIEKNKTILVIEDEILLRSLMRKGLEKKGFNVLEAVNGCDGVDIFEKEKPSLVVTDMLMPDKEGMQTIQELRQIDPNVKIVAMSGGGSTKNMAFLEMAERVGASATIAKPFKPQDLFNIIEGLL